MSVFAHAMPGHFYAVGVGPGSPDLLTLRAVNIIRSAGVLIAPRSEASSESLALRVVRDLCDGQKIIEHVYPMERDAGRTSECWSAMASLVAERCGAGQSVAHLTIGDPLLYSTASYLLQQLATRLPPACMHVVTGVSAFQATAAIVGRPLTLQEDRLLLMPATDLEEVERALERCETLVLYKVGPRARALCGLLARRNLAQHAFMVCYAEQGGKELVVSGLESLPEGRTGYLSTVIVHVGRREWSAERT